MDLYTQILCYYGGFPVDVFPSVTQGHKMGGQSIYILHLYIYGGVPCLYHKIHIIKFNAKVEMYHPR